MASIKKLINGKYKVSVYDKNGKRHRIVFDHLKNAKAFNAKIEKEKSDFKLIDHGLMKPKYSFDDAVKEYFKTMTHLRAKTVQKYKNILNQFLLFTEENKISYIDQFKREHADLFRDQLFSSQASAKTINDYLQLAKTLMQIQVDKDRLLKNPFSHVQLAKKPAKTMIEREQDFYDSDEIKRFFQNIKLPHNFIIFLGLFLTGCRIAELASLKWKGNIDFNDKIIKIRNIGSFKTKTSSSERNIPMTNKLYEILLELYNNTNSEYIFAARQGGQIRERKVLSDCKNIAERAGIKKNATVHKWRHTFSSHLANSGLSFEERQTLMGHSPKTMTEFYTKIDVSKLHEKISYLDTLLPEDLLND